MHENILVVAMISCRFWLYMGPVVATFYLTNFLATDRKRVRVRSEGRGWYTFDSAARSLLSMSDRFIGTGEVRARTSLR